LFIIVPLLVFELKITLPVTSKVALFVNEPVPKGPLVAFPNVPTEDDAILKVPALLTVPPEYVLWVELNTNIHFLFLLKIHCLQ